MTQMAFTQNSLGTFSFSFNNKDATQRNYEILYKSSLQYNCLEGELFETVFQSELKKEISICFLQLESILAAISNSSHTVKIPYFVQMMKLAMLWLCKHEGGKSKMF